MTSCKYCRNSETEVQAAMFDLRQVTRRALKNPSWPSNLEKVRAAKEKLADTRDKQSYHRNTEHPE